MYNNSSTTSNHQQQQQQQQLHNNNTSNNNQLHHPSNNFLFTNSVTNGHHQKNEAQTTTTTTAMHQQQQQQIEVGEMSESNDVDQEKSKNSKKTRSKKPKKTTVTNNKEVIIRKHRKHISLEDIAQCFEMPIRDASQILGISLTQLKRLCREYNISRWPYRRLNSIQRRIDVLVIMLKRCEESGDAKCYHQTMEEKEKLEEEVKTIKNDPKYLCTGSSSFLGDSSDDEDDGEMTSRLTASNRKQRGVSPPQNLPQIHNVQSTQPAMQIPPPPQSQQQAQIHHQHMQHQQINTPPHHHHHAISSPPIKIVAHNNANSGKSKLIINQNRYSPYPTMSISPQNNSSGNGSGGDFNSMQGMFHYGQHATNNNNGNNNSNNSNGSSGEHQSSDSLTTLMSIDPAVNPNITGANRRIVVKLEAPSPDSTGHQQQQQQQMKRRNAHDHSNLVDMMRSDHIPASNSTPHHQTIQQQQSTHHHNNNNNSNHNHNYPYTMSPQNHLHHHQQSAQMQSSLDLSCRRLSKQMESLKFLDSDRSSRSDSISDNLSLSLDPSGFSDDWSMYTSSFQSNNNAHPNVVNGTSSNQQHPSQEWIFNHSYQPATTTSNGFYHYSKTK